MQIRTVDEGRNHRRELWLDDETQVAHLWVIDYTMRIGTAEVRMAGIGGVHTDYEHRMKGHMRRLFEDTVAYMTAEGYDVSMLFGIPNFYNKFGYATCLTDSDVSVKTRDAEAAGAEALALTPRAVAPADFPGIVALYNVQNASRTGTIVRDPMEFTAFRKGTHWETEAEAVLWEDAAAGLLGYVVCDRDRHSVTVAEVGAATPEIFPSVLTYLAQQAVDKRCESIRLALPLDDAFGEYLQRFGCQWQVRYPRYGDGMMRILNQEPLFEKIAPELARRAAGEIPINGVSLRTDLGELTIRPDGGAFKIEAGVAGGPDLAISQDKLMQLIMGYRSIADVLNSPSVAVTGGGPAPFAALFPRASAFVWPPDEF